jgi:ribosomal protein S18 acetylase RimI-like enzyme
MQVSVAITSDIPEMVQVINSAYRGEASRKGWTTEADMIEGELRTDEEQIYSLMLDPSVTFLKYKDESQLQACVFLQVRNVKLYLGMLSVSPSAQARGIGKQLMNAAEEHAVKCDCPVIYMRVIKGRDSLIEWYQRQGYELTGEVQPFEDSKYGRAKKPLEFVVLEKKLREQTKGQGQP